MEYSSVLNDVKVYYIRFYGRDERRSWADPIRSKILQRLAGDGFTWYINIDDRPFDDTRAGFGRLPLHRELPGGFISRHELQYLTFRDERGLDLPQRRREILVERYGTHKIAMFFEAPTDLMDEIFSDYWPRIAHGTSAQGYLLPDKKISYLEEWNEQTRDDLLFRKVMETVSLAFTTIGAHAPHIIFLTKKFSLEEFKTRIEIADLQVRIEKFNE